MSVFNLPKCTPTTPLLSSLHWLPVAARILFKTLVVAYRAVNGSGPVCIQDMVKPYTPARPLPIGLLLPHCELTTLQNPDCLLCWLRNERAPQWHQDSRKSTPLPPQTKYTSLPITPWWRRWCLITNSIQNKKNHLDLHVALVVGTYLVLVVLGLYPHGWMHLL